MKTGLARGSRAESDIINYIYFLLSKTNCPAIILSSFTITELSVKVINQMLDLQTSGLKAQKQPMEFTDILCVSPKFGILLFEIKATEKSDKNRRSGQVKDAIKQLREAEQWVKQLFEEGLKLNCPINKICALPNMSKSNFQISASSNHENVEFHYLFKDDIISKSNFLDKFENKSEIPYLTDENYHSICKVLLLSKVIVKASVSSLHVAEQQLSRICSMKETLNTLTTQSFLKGAYDMQEGEYAKQEKEKKKKQPKVSLEGSAKIKSNEENNFTPVTLEFREETNQQKRNKIQKRGEIRDVGEGLLNLIMFLTPEQLICMEDMCRSQTIFGYAGTGKTVLVQNKVVEIFFNDAKKEEKVIVLLPDTLLSMYNKFFEMNLEDFKNLAKTNRLLVINFSGLINMQLKTFSGYHIFLDELHNALELATCSSEELVRILNLLIDALENNNDKYFFWKTEDYSQNFNTSDNFAVSQYKDELRESFGALSNFNFLTSSLRSTVRIFEQWREYSNSICLFSGHNVLGDDITYKFIPLTEYTFDNVYNLVKDSIVTLRNIGWKYEDIAILIETNHLQLYGNSKKLMFFSLPKLTDYVNQEATACSLETEEVQGISCANRYLMPSSYTVDTASKSFSHEWPVVITILDQFVTNTIRYLARSRCLVELIVIEPDFGGQGLEPIKWMNNHLSQDYEMFRFVNNYSKGFQLHNSIKEFSQILTSWFKSAKKDNSFESQPIPWEKRCKESLIRSLNNFYIYNQELVAEIRLLQKSEQSIQKDEENSFLLNLIFDTVENYYATLLLLQQLVNIFNFVKDKKQTFSFAENRELLMPYDWLSFNGELSQWQILWEREMNFQIPRDFKKNLQTQSQMSFLFNQF